MSPAVRLRPEPTTGPGVPGQTARVGVSALLGFAVGGVTSLAFAPVAIHTYGAEASGQWIAVVATFAILGFLELGMTTGLSLSHFADQLYWRGVATWLYLWSAAILIGTVLAAATLSLTTFQLAACVAGASTSLASLLIPPAAAALIRSGSTVALYRINLWARCLRMPSLLVPPLLGLSPWVMAVGLVLANTWLVVRLVRAGAVAGLSPGAYRPTRRVRTVWPVLRFGALASTGTATDLVVHQVGRVTLGHYAGDAAAAYYGAVSSAAQGLQQLGSAFNSHLLSVAVGSGDAGALAHRPSGRYHGIAVLYVMIPAALGSFVLGNTGFAVRSLTGRADVGLTVSLGLLIVAVLAILAVSPLAVWLLARNRAREVAVASGVGTVVTVVLNLALVRDGRIVGAAVAVAVGILVTCAFFVATATRRGLTALVAGPALVCALPALAVFAVSLAPGLSGRSGWGHLLVGVVTGVLAPTATVVAAVIADSTLRGSVRHRLRRIRVPQRTTVGEHG